LGLFVALSNNSGSTSACITSPDGITWTARTTPSGGLAWFSVAWSAELGYFVGSANSGTNRIMVSPNGINWTSVVPPFDNSWYQIAWSADLGIFCAVGELGTVDQKMLTTAPRARPPTSYNVFDSSFNNIDPSGNWTFKCKELSSNDTNVSLGSTSGNTELKCNAVGAGGSISLTGGTGLLAATAGGSSGQHLVLTINTVQYKIALLNP
jgi:hypothetical protein